MIMFSSRFVVLCHARQIFNSLMLISLITVKPYKKGRGNMTFAASEHLAISLFFLVCSAAKIKLFIEGANIGHEPVLAASLDVMSDFLRAIIGAVGFEFIIICAYHLMRAEPRLR